MKITSTIPFEVEDVLLGRNVMPGETVDVTADQARHRLVQAANWVPADDEAKAIAAELQAAAEPSPEVKAPTNPKRTRKPKPATPATSVTTENQE
jgi:hypothetical protein